MGNKISSKKYLKSFHLTNKRPSNITSSVKEMDVINILRNDKDLKLYFNNDNNTYRQHNHYFLKKHLFQCEFSSPIKEKLINGGKVLDLGCGPATFLLDVSAQYPNSKCIGVDIEPLFPTEIKPENLEFKIADIFQRLPFPDNEFDLVHLETILFSTTPAQLNFLIGEMIRITKPNGYIEFVETHMTSRSRGVGEKFGQLLRGFELVANSGGASPDMVLKLPKLLTTNPTIDNINIKSKSLVLGKNGGRMGILIQDIFGWFNSSSDLFVNDACKQLNITKEQYDELVQDTFDEVNFTFPEVCFIRIHAQKKNLIN